MEMDARGGVLRRWLRGGGCRRSDGLLALAGQDAQDRTRTRIEKCLVAVAPPHDVGRLTVAAAGLDHLALAYLPLDGRWGQDDVVTRVRSHDVLLGGVPPECTHRAILEQAEGPGI